MARTGQRHRPDGPTSESKRLFASPHALFALAAAAARYTVFATEPPPGGDSEKTPTAPGEAAPRVPDSEQLPEAPDVPQLPASLDSAHRWGNYEPTRCTTRLGGSFWWNSATRQWWASPNGHRAPLIEGANTFGQIPIGVNDPVRHGLVADWVFDPAMQVDGEPWRDTIPVIRLRSDHPAACRSLYDAYFFYWRDDYVEPDGAERWKFTELVERYMTGFDDMVRAIDVATHKRDTIDRTRYPRTSPAFFAKRYANTGQARDAFTRWVRTHLATRGMANVGLLDVGTRNRIRREHPDLWHTLRQGEWFGHGYRGVGILDYAAAKDLIDRYIALDIPVYYRWPHGGEGVEPSHAPSQEVKNAAVNEGDPTLSMQLPDARMSKTQRRKFNKRRNELLEHDMDRIRAAFGGVYKTAAGFGPSGAPGAQGSWDPGDAALGVGQPGYTKGTAKRKRVALQKDEFAKRHGWRPSNAELKDALDNDYDDDDDDYPYGGVDSEEERYLAPLAGYTSHPDNEVQILSDDDDAATRASRRPSESSSGKRARDEWPLPHEEATKRQRRQSPPGVEHAHPAPQGRALSSAPLHVLPRPEAPGAGAGNTSSSAAARQAYSAVVRRSLEPQARSADAPARREHRASPPSDAPHRRSPPRRSPPRHRSPRRSPPRRSPLRRSPSRDTRWSRGRNASPHRDSRAYRGRSPSRSYVPSASGSRYRSPPRQPRERRYSRSPRRSSPRRATTAQRPDAQGARAEQLEPRVAVASPPKVESAPPATSQDGPPVVLRGTRVDIQVEEEPARAPGALRDNSTAMEVVAEREPIRDDDAVSYYSTTPDYLRQSLALPDAQSPDAMDVDNREQAQDVEFAKADTPPPAPESNAAPALTESRPMHAVAAEALAYMVASMNAALDGVPMQDGVRPAFVNTLRRTLGWAPSRFIREDASAPGPSTSSGSREEVHAAPGAAGSSRRTLAERFTDAPSTQPLDAPRQPPRAPLTDPLIVAMRTLRDRRWTPPADGTRPSWLFHLTHTAQPHPIPRALLDALVQAQPQLDPFIVRMRGAVEYGVDVHTLYEDDGTRHGQRRASQLSIDPSASRRDQLAQWFANVQTLMQRPHARAFLLAGGLSWRIARVFLDEVDAMAGPSVNAQQHGSPQIADDGFPGQYGYDDFLTDDEWDILMGRINDQFIFPSPRDFRSSHATWDGVWTEEDEAWFIDHLRYFIDGSPIFSQQRWRARMRANGATRRHRGQGFSDSAVPGLRRGRGKGKAKGKEKDD